MATNRYPATASVPRAPGARPGVARPVEARATPADAIGGGPLGELMATAGGRYWLSALVIAAAVASTTGPASNDFFWTWLRNSSWNAFWTSLYPGMNPEPGLA